MLPDTTIIAADHVAIVVLKVTDTASNIVTIVLKERLRVTCKGEKGEGEREREREREKGEGEREKEMEFFIEDTPQLKIIHYEQLI